jgi:hypothetical protein
VWLLRPRAPCGHGHGQGNSSVIPASEPPHRGPLSRCGAFQDVLFWLVLLCEDCLRQRIAGGVLRQRVVGIDDPRLRVLRVDCVFEQVEQVPCTDGQAVPWVQITPKWLGLGVTCVCVNVEPPSVLWAK